MKTHHSRHVLHRRRRRRAVESIALFFLFFCPVGFPHTGPLRRRIGLGISAGLGQEARTRTSRIRLSGQVLLLAGDDVSITCWRWRGRPSGFVVIKLRVFTACRGSLRLGRRPVLEPKLLLDCSPTALSGGQFLCLWARRPQDFGGVAEELDRPDPARPAAAQPT